MKQGDDLYQLIRTLSIPEKRYFRLFAQRHVIGEKNSYEVLFDLVDAQVQKGIYNEQDVKKKLPAKAATHLAAGKHYLYELILRSMRGFHENKSRRDAIHQRLIDIRFLMDKGLYAKSRQFIQSAKKDALEIEYFAGLIELLYLERRMLRLSLDKDADTTFSDISALEQDALQKISDELFYRTLYDQNFVLLQEKYTPAEREDLSRIRIGTIQQKTRATSFNAMALHYSILADDAQLRRKFDEARSFMREVVQLFEEAPLMRAEQSQRYINVLSNYLNSCFLARDFSDFQPVLRTLAKIKPQKEEEEVLLFRSRYMLELLYYMNQSDWTRAEKLFPDIRSGLKRFAGRLPEGSVLVLHYNMATVYFMQRNYAKSLDSFVFITDSASKNIRRDLQKNAQLLQIVVHYELEHFNLVKSMLLNLKRRLQKDTITTLEQIIIQLLNKLTDTPDKKEKQQLYVQADEALQTIAAGSKNIQGLEELRFWISKYLPA
ncbi:MAG: hypothetical protein R2794_01265 [Chitinophagales bacterium]